MEEPRSPVSLEAYAQRLLQRRAHRLKLRCIVRRLDPRQPVARIGGEQPRQISRLRERGSMRQRTSKVFTEARSGPPRECTRLLKLAPEIVRAVRQSESLQLRRTARRILAHQHEVAQVGHQHQTIVVPVATGLIAHCREQGIVVRRLDLDRAALRHLAFTWVALLHLLRGVKSKVRATRALVRELTDAEHFWRERRADRV